MGQWREDIAHPKQFFRKKSAKKQPRKNYKGERESATKTCQNLKAAKQEEEV